VNIRVNISGGLLIENFSPPYTSIIVRRYSGSAVISSFWKPGPRAISPLLLHQLYITRYPGFIEPGLQRAIEAQQNEPAFARNSLNPVPEGAVELT
jgi:hypothetical protein